MDEKLLNDIIDLESENMLPILRDAGIRFERDKLFENLNRPQDIITIYNKGNLMALLRYKLDKDQNAKVLSIQLKDPKVNKIYMHALMKRIKEDFSKKDVRNIISVVQKGNTESHQFHERLGFKVDKEFEKAIRYKLDFSLMR